MTVNDRPRTEPVAGHTYTLPVVREVPRTGSPSAPSAPCDAPSPRTRDLVAPSLLLCPDGHAPRA